MGLVWLFWFLRWLRVVWLPREVRGVVGFVSVRGVLGEDDVNFLVAQLYPKVRTVAYFAWYGQVLFNWVQCERSGLAVDYVPSMSGVSPRFVRRVVVEALRAPEGERVRRLSDGLGGVVSLVAREATQAMADSSVDVWRGALDYTLRFGHPVVRFNLMVSDPTSEVGGVVGRDVDLQAHVEALNGLFVDSLKDIDVSGVSDSEWVERLEARGVVFDDGSLDDAELELEGRRRRDVDRELLLLDARSDSEVLRAMHESAVQARMFLYDLSEFEADRQRRQEFLRERREAFEKYRRRLVELHGGSRVGFDESLAQLREIYGIGETLTMGKPSRRLSGMKSSVVSTYAIGYARVAVGAYTCPFCLMLCARGPVYRSNSVLGTPGRVKRLKKTGEGSLFVGAYGQEAYHDNCDCVMVPVFSKEGYEGKEYADGASRLYEYYAKNADRELFFDKGKVSMNGFARWLNSVQGRRMAQRFMPDGVHVNVRAGFDGNLVKYRNKVKKQSMVTV